MPDIQHGKFAALNTEVSKALLNDYTMIHELTNHVRGRIPATREALVRFFIVYMSNQSCVNPLTMIGFYHTAAWLFATTPEDVKEAISTFLPAMGNLNTMLSNAILDDAIEFFLEERNVPDLRDALKNYAAWCKALNLRWSRVTESHAVKYLRHLHLDYSQPLRDGVVLDTDTLVEYVEKHRYAVNSFLEWCVQNGIIWKNPFRNIPRIECEADLVALGEGT